MLRLSETVHLLIDVEVQRDTVTALWRASGERESTRPPNWQRTQRAQEFITALAQINMRSAHIAIQHGGSDGGGTWAHGQIGVEDVPYFRSID